MKQKMTFITGTKAYFILNDLKLLVDLYFIRTEITLNTLKKIIF